MIKHNQPFVSPEDRASVDAVLQSGWIAQGPATRALEAEVCNAFGGGGAVALSSGTAALFVALTRLGAGKGARVVLPTYSCSALLNAVFLAGARPCIVDVAEDTFCLSEDAVRVQAANSDFIVAVHTFGAAADIQSLRRFGVPIVEDCCQAIGGLHQGRLLGSTGEAAVFSFYATKIIAAGQGGLIWAANRSFIESVRDYREFDGCAVYTPRFNFQFTDIQASLAHNQFKRIDSIRARRALIAGQYLAALPRGFGIQAQVRAAGRMVQRFVVVAPDSDSRDALRKHLTSRDIGCIVPVETFELLHRYLNLDPGDFPIAEHLAQTTLSLPLHACLTDEEVDHVCSALLEFKL